MIEFLHNYLPSPILFQIGELKIYWYGFLVVLGVCVGLIVLIKLARFYKITSDEVFDLVFYLIIFGLLGSRLYAILINLPFYLAYPSEIIKVWHGGLAIHGAVIAGVITLIIYCKKKGQSFWQWADLLAPAIALGQAIGRWGNYFNQELFGRPTSLPWGILISSDLRPIEYLDKKYFQPVFLYESILNFLNFLLLIFLFFKLKNKPQKTGLVFLIYLVNYSAIRILLEFLRLDETPIIFGMRWPILVSALIIAGGLALIIFRQGFAKRRI